MTDARPFCPRCKLRWRETEMISERGSWSLQMLLRCPYCRLVDYPDEEGPRRFGPVIWRAS